MSTGRNLTNGTIEIGEYKADDRLRVGGILYLEEKLGKSFEEIADDLSKAFDTDNVMISGMVRGMSPILVALVLQRNPDADDKAVEQEIMRLELEDFTKIFDSVKMFEPAKNEDKPTPAKPRKRKKVVLAT